ncbi:hypothetical protein ACLBXM_09045 [Xanthobacteraceae bacterium A53D]
MLASFRDALRNWRRRPDNALLHLAFVVLLGVSGAMVAQDVQSMWAEPAPGAPLSRPGAPDMTEAPSTTPLAPARRGGGQEAPRISPDKALAAPMSFELLADGRLMATGTITPGIAATFAAEVEKRGTYVKTVVLQSPGGSVRDALEMGRLIRARGFATEVKAGGYCASSCPLVFAGGTERRAGAKAGIGVHQVYAAERLAGQGPDGMETAQRITAECQRYLRDMGIDLEVWMHAMETPRDSLFYFTPAEMERLKLTTGPARA